MKKSYGHDEGIKADTLSAIAEAYYGVPNEFKNKARTYLDNNIL